jgi:hypothetical protein
MAGNAWPINPPDPRDVLGKMGGSFDPDSSRWTNSLEVNYGAPPNYTTNAMAPLNPQKVANPWSAIPIASGEDDYFDAIAVHEQQSGVYMHPDDRDLYSASTPTTGANYTNLAGMNMMGPDGAYTVPGIPSPLGGPNSVSGDPAQLSEVPTSSTDPGRPRTVAAGYDGSRKVITVVFRDGTYYNYYDCSVLEWSNFKRAHSKGRFILSYLDFKARGVADVASLPSAARESLYKITRTGQFVRKGVTGAQTDKSRSAYAAKYARGQKTYRSGNLGGSTRKRTS